MPLWIDCLIHRKNDSVVDSSQFLARFRAAERRVIVDGQLTTSRGPGTAFEFALSLVEQLFGSEKMKEVANPMVMYSMEQKVAQVT